MNHRSHLRTEKGDVVVADCYDSSSYYSHYSDSCSSDSHSSYSSESENWKRGSTHKCGKECHTPCDKIKHQVEKAFSHGELAKGIDHCPDVETKVEHCYSVKMGKHKVKKQVLYNHVIVADVTHHVKENVNCLHRYHKDICHKDKCKTVDGNDCKEKCDPKCKPEKKYYDDKSCRKPKCGKCGKSKKSSCSSSYSSKKCRKTIHSVVSH